MKDIKDIKKYIRSFKDFPDKGVIFRDIIPIFNSVEAYHFIVDHLANKITELGGNFLITPEARGFLFVPSIAYKLGIPFTVCRKENKLPPQLNLKKIPYHSEYSKNYFEVDIDSIPKNAKIILIDDVVATGGAMLAITNFLSKNNFKIQGLLSIANLNYLEGPKKLKKYNLHTLISYDH